MQGGEPRFFPDGGGKDRDIGIAVCGDIEPEPLNHCRHWLNGNHPPCRSDPLGCKAREDATIGTDIDKDFAGLDMLHDTHEADFGCMEASDENIALRGVVAQITAQLDALNLDIEADAGQRSFGQVSECTTQHTLANCPAKQRRPSTRLIKPPARRKEWCLYHLCLTRPVARPFAARKAQHEPSRNSIVPSLICKRMCPTTPRDAISRVWRGQWIPTARKALPSNRFHRIRRPS